MRVEPDGVRVSVCDEQGRAMPIELGRWLTRIAPPRVRGVVTIAVVSDARVRALNRTYRQRDYPTDVLSFPAEQDLSPQSTQRTRSTTPHSRRQAVLDSVDSVRSVVDRRPFLGDIVIARGVARRQARRAGHDEATELRVLALHGLLHLLGYDHEHDAGEMARLERRLRRKAGLRDGLIERAEP